MNAPKLVVQKKCNFDTEQSILSLPTQLRISLVRKDFNVATELDWRSEERRVLPP